MLGQLKTSGQFLTRQPFEFMTTIKDGHGNTVGYTVDVSPHRKEIRTRSNALAGWFNPNWGHNGATFDSAGAKIGEGDLRSALVDFTEH